MMTTDLDDLRKPHREIVLHWRDDLDAWELFERMLQGDITKQERARYDTLAQREIDTEFPPPESLLALRRALGPPKPGSNAERFLRAFP